MKVYIHVREVGQCFGCLAVVTSGQRLASKRLHETRTFPYGQRGGAASAAAAWAKEAGHVPYIKTPNGWVADDEVTITVVCEPEHVQVRGHFDYDTEQENREMEAQILAELNEGNTWAWCCVKVVAELHGIQGESSWLGCCSYASEADFRQPGGYFDDLRDEALGELRKKIAAVQGVCV